MPSAKEIQTAARLAGRVLAASRKDRNGWPCNAYIDKFGRTCVTDGFRAYRINARLNIPPVPYNATPADAGNAERLYTGETGAFAQLDFGTVSPIPAPDPVDIARAVAESKGQRVPDGYSLGDYMPAVRPDYIAEALALLPGGQWYVCPAEKRLFSPVYVVSALGSVALLPVRKSGVYDAEKAAAAAPAPAAVAVPLPAPADRPAAETVADVLTAAPAEKAPWLIRPGAVLYKVNGRAGCMENAQYSAEAAPVAPADRPAAPAPAEAAPAAADRRPVVAVAYANYSWDRKTVARGVLRVAPAHQSYMPAAVLAGVYSPAEALAALLTAAAPADRPEAPAADRPARAAVAPADRLAAGAARAAVAADQAITIIRNAAEAAPIAPDVLTAARALADVLTAAAAAVYKRKGVRDGDYRHIAAVAAWLARLVTAAEAAPVAPAADRPAPVAPADRPAAPVPAEAAPVAPADRPAAPADQAAPAEAAAEKRAETAAQAPAADRPANQAPAEAAPVAPADRPGAPAEAAPADQAAAPITLAALAALLTGAAPAPAAGPAPVAPAADRPAPAPADRSAAVAPAADRSAAPITLAALAALLTGAA